MRLSLFFMFLFLFSYVNGQIEEPKFGKIEMSDLTMTKYDKDTTAGALILFNSGKCGIILSPNQSFQYQYDRHCQIKIFKNSAFGVGDISFQLYKNGQSEERLKYVNAVTYNLVDGKIVKTKLDSKKIYKSEEGKYINVSFAFPDIKEGSIIEYSYTIISDFLYNFRGWTFQYKIPAVWSQYVYTIPEYFSYREASKGYLKFDVQQKKQANVSFAVPTEVEVNQSGISKTLTRTEFVNAKATQSTLAVKDVPAFIPEPNIDCEDNYIQSIEFELSSIAIPGGSFKNYTETWESVNNMMKDDPDFGVLLRNKAFIDDTVKAICTNKSNEIDKAQVIYDYVRNRMKWDGTYRIFSSRGLKKPFTDRTGNSSEINLLLTLMLQTAGLAANPVMFSTQENGIAVSFYPTITKYNSVLAMLNIGGKIYLLDARSKYCPFGILPANDINGQGRVVDNSTGSWVDLNASGKYNINKTYNLEILSDGKLNGLISEIYDGYAGLNFRNSLNTEKSTDDFIRKLQENTSGLTINNFSISNKDDIYKPVSDTMKVEITDNAEIIGDKIMFTPMLFEAISKNRYTLEERKYPVNYNYPISEKYTFLYTLPKGYSIESLPQSASIKMPDNSILISYNVQKIEDKIMIIYKRDIMKVMFLPDQYKSLKDLYDQLVNKNSEKIILKKI